MILFTYRVAWGLIQYQYGVDVVTVTSGEVHEHRRQHRHWRARALTLTFGGGHPTGFLFPAALSFPEGHTRSRSPGFESRCAPAWGARCWPSGSSPPATRTGGSRIGAPRRSGWWSPAKLGQLRPPRISLSAIRIDRQQKRNKTINTWGTLQSNPHWMGQLWLQPRNKRKGQID